MRLYAHRLGGDTYIFSNIGDFLANRTSQVAVLGDVSAPSPFNGGITGNRFAKAEWYVGYAQDEWRIRPNLVVNYGLRHEYHTPRREDKNRVVLFNTVTGTGPGCFGERGCGASRAAVCVFCARSATSCPNDCVSDIQLSRSVPTGWVGTGPERFDCMAAQPDLEALIARTAEGERAQTKLRSRYVLTELQTVWKVNKAGEIAAGAWWSEMANRPAPRKIEK